ncbi:NUDIX domain-containing protein [Candidatus Saccharibacteria bacterium]|nr:NUDIX domain-containing protein [Candidatus Saccharibacteria bacterium]
MKFEVHQSVGAIIIDGDDCVLQVRDNKDGVLWPGKIHYWGGAVEPDDESSPEKAILRELKEELDIDLREVDLVPFHRMSVAYNNPDNKHGEMSVHLYIANLTTRRALHAYEGSNIFRLNKNYLVSELDSLEITPYLHEALIGLRDYFEKYYE